MSDYTNTNTHTKPQITNTNNTYRAGSRKPEHNKTTGSNKNQPERADKTCSVHGKCRHTTEECRAQTCTLHGRVGHSTTECRALKRQQGASHTNAASNNTHANNTNTERNSRPGNRAPEGNWRNQRQSSTDRYNNNCLCRRLRNVRRLARNVHISIISISIARTRKSRR